MVFPWGKLRNPLTSVPVWHPRGVTQAWVRAYEVGCATRLLMLIPVVPLRSPAGLRTLPRTTIDDSILVLRPLARGASMDLL